MKSVFLSLGSNIDAKKNILAALDILADKFGALVVSPVYESEAVGFDGDNFLNLVVSIESELELPDLVKELKAVEDTLGRERSGPKFSSRLIDIDVIFYGNACGNINGIELPRYEVYENAYVLLPMKHLSPEFVDPKTGQTMLELWESKQLIMEQQKLWQVEL